MTDKHKKNGWSDDEIEAGKREFTKSRGDESHYYVEDDILKNDAEAIKFLEFLRTRSETDYVQVHLHNHGGAADMGLRISRAMKQCRGFLDVQVDSDCYSAGAIMAVAGHKLTMQPGTFLMFHNYSTGAIGKGNDVVAMVEHEDYSIWSQMQDICHPFLTKKEISKLRAGEDIYIHAPAEKALTKAQKEKNKKLLIDLMVRSKRHFDYLKDLEIPE